MITLLTLLYFLLGKVEAGTLADNYMDSLLGEPLEKAIVDMRLDPMPLPDFTLPFRIEFGAMPPISGRLEYFNGIFNGISKIRRLAECDGPTFNINEVKIECLLNLFGMSAVYDSKVYVEQLPPLPYQVTGYVNETHVRNGIAGRPASLNGEVKAFEITKFGDINVRLSNLGMLQFVYNFVEERFRERVREELTKIIISELPRAFKMAMTQVSLPGMG